MEGKKMSNGRINHDACFLFFFFITLHQVIKFLFKTILKFLFIATNYYLVSLCFTLRGLPKDMFGNPSVCVLVVWLNYLQIRLWSVSHCNNTSDPNLWELSHQWWCISIFISDGHPTPICDPSKLTQSELYVMYNIMEIFILKSFYIFLLLSDSRLYFWDDIMPWFRDILL